MQGVHILMTFLHVCAKKGCFSTNFTRPGLVVPVFVLSPLLCVDTCFYESGSGGSENNILGVRWINLQQDQVPVQVNFVQGEEWAVHVPRWAQDEAGLFDPSVGISEFMLFLMEKPG